jgi:hypothetical protein
MSFFFFPILVRFRWDSSLSDAPFARFNLRLCCKGITANLLDNIISSTDDVDAVVIVVVAVVTTAGAAIVAAVVVVVVTVEADTVTTVDRNEFTLEETAKPFGEDALAAGNDDLFRDELTLLDGETALLPDVLNTFIADEDRDAVTLLGEDMVTLLTGEVCLTGDEEILLFAAVTLTGEDTLVAITVHGLLTRPELLLSDTDLLVGDVALFACVATLFAAGDTLHEEVTLPTDDGTFCVGDIFAAGSTVASDDPPTLQSTTMEVLTASRITLESLETVTTFPEFALALLDTVRLLGGGVVIATPDNLLLLVVAPSVIPSLLLFTDV